MCLNCHSCFTHLQSERKGQVKILLLMESLYTILFLSPLIYIEEFFWENFHVYPSRDFVDLEDMKKPAKLINDPKEFTAHFDHLPKSSEVPYYGFPLQFERLKSMFQVHYTGGDNDTDLVNDSNSNKIKLENLEKEEIWKNILKSHKDYVFGSEGKDFGNASKFYKDSDSSGQMAEDSKESENVNVEVQARNSACPDKTLTFIETDKSKDISEIDSDCHVVDDISIKTCSEKESVTDGNRDSTKNDGTESDKSKEISEKDSDCHVVDDIIIKTCSEQESVPDGNGDSTKNDETLNSVSSEAKVCLKNVNIQNSVDSTNSISESLTESISDFDHFLNNFPEIKNHGVNETDSLTPSALQRAQLQFLCSKSAKLAISLSETKLKFPSNLCATPTEHLNKLR